MLTEDWHPFRRHLAIGTDGTLTRNGEVDIFDAETGVPVETRHMSQPGQPRGSGAVMGPVAVVEFATVEFEARAVEVYGQSGDNAPIRMSSTEGAVAEGVRRAIETSVGDTGIAVLLEDPDSEAYAALARTISELAPDTTSVEWASIPQKPTETVLTGTGGVVVNGAAITLEDRLSAASLSATFTAQQLPKLRRWYAALASRRTVPAQVLGIGDSITEGTGTTNVRNRWLNILQDDLRARFNAEGGAVFPFIPAYPATTSPGMPVVRSGTVNVSNFGLGLRAAGLPDSTGSITFTFTGTSAKAMFVRVSGGGNALISIDGGAPTTVSTNHTALVGGYTWDTGPLTRGVHTVTITRGSGVVYPEGLLTYDGDETSGIRVLDGAKHGSSSGTFFPTSAWAYSAASAGPIGLCIVALGTNDYGNRTALEFRNYIATIPVKLRQQGFNGSMLYVAPYKAGSRPDADWKPFVDQLRDLANNDPDSEFLDLSTRMPTPITPEPQPASLGLYVDSLHPSDAGNGYIGDVIAGYISPR